MRGMIMLLPLISEFCAGDTCPPMLAFVGVATVEA